jgi:broad specificity phosphatase PhoE
MRLYLIRHGAIDNANARRIVGRLDLPLLPEGETQAAALARMFRKVPLDHLYASPLKRTWQTARALSETSGVSAVAQPAWMELAFGKLDGRLLAEAEKEHPALFELWHQGDLAFRAPEGESLGELRARVEGSLEALSEAHYGRSVAIVTHGGPIRMTLALLMKNSFASSHALRIDFTGVTVIDFHRDRSLVVCTNSLAHLDGGLGWGSLPSF